MKVARGYNQGAICVSWYAFLHLGTIGVDTPYKALNTQAEVDIFAE